MTFLKRLFGPLRNPESRSSSMIALILVNLFPLYGVLFWGWKIFPIMLLFWSENIMIGFFNILRMIGCKPGDRMLWLAKLFMVPFFTLHYGGFTAGHGLFVIALFGRGFSDQSTVMNLEDLPRLIMEFRLTYAMAALFLSHGYSFIVNYISKGEFRKVELNTLMVMPYARVVLLHITLIFGGILMMILQSHLAGLIFFIFLKLIMDLFAHGREHRPGRYRSS